MKLYYTNYATGEGIDAENPIEVEAQYVVDTFLDLLDERDNFLGLIDDDGKCIQFINEDSRWLMDIPNPPDFINQQTYLNDRECVNLIVDIVENNKISTNMKLYSVNTMEETLADVLDRNEK